MNNDVEEVIVGGLVVVAMFAGVLALSFLLGGALIYLGWNYGVAVVFGVPQVPFMAAGFLAMFLGVIRNTLTGR